MSNIGEVGIWLTILSLIVLFWGEPDIHSAIIDSLTCQEEVKVD